MNNTLADAIVSAASTPMSATSLARAVGKSKGYMIAEELQSLVSSGRLEEDNSGKFTVYKAKTNVTVRATNTATASQQNTIVVDSQQPQTETVPDGYTVSKMVKNKRTGAKGHIITLPGSTEADPKKVFVESGYSLIVINNEPIKIVKTPVSAMQCVQEYADAHQMTPYNVRQSKVGTIGKVSDIQSFSGIIDLRVEKSNKAANA